MDSLSPKLVRQMFIASTVMMIVAVGLSAFNAASVLSAPRLTVVGIPSTVGFEGFLSGVSDGTHTLTFRVYDMASGGTALWTEALSSTQVTNGLYSVALGATTAFTSTTFNGDRWIGVTVDSGSEITPRTRVSSVPFALNADNANKIGGGGTANMVTAFDGPCPNGWTEYGAAQGRTIVGVPANGTLGGIPNGSTPLTDKEDRTHTHTTPNHEHNPKLGPVEYLNGADYNVNPVYTRYGGIGGAIGYTGGSQNGVNYQKVLTGTALDGSGTTGTAATSQILPYIQLRYCKLNP